jgi:hypothetical protein
MKNILTLLQNRGNHNWKKEFEITHEFEELIQLKSRMELFSFQRVTDKPIHMRNGEEPSPPFACTWSHTNSDILYYGNEEGLIYRSTIQDENTSKVDWVAHNNVIFDIDTSLDDRILVHCLLTTGLCWCRQFR